MEDREIVDLLQDGGPALYLRKSSFTQEEAESFDGDLFSLGKYFEEGKVFLDASADYDFAETFGYSDYQGVLFTSDGNALNPLEEERCVRWLRLLNEYKAQITQKAAYNWDFSLSLSFPGTGIGEGNRPEDFTSGQQGDGLRHFSSANEKKAYYREWILASPVLSLQNPEVCDEMNVANDYREQLVYAKDFDETLKEAKQKTGEAMQKVLKKLK